MSAHIRWLFAVALLSSTYDARAAIDCTTPQGVLALMMAGAIEF